MEAGGTVEAAWPPWLIITIAVISLVGVVVMAVVGPMMVERFESGRTTPESPESSAIAQRVSDAVTLIQSAITDLQTRIGGLEVTQMTDAHDQRG
jgi:hypothetical protein